MYIPEWVLGLVLLIAFFGVLVVSDQHEREKHQLQERINRLEQELADKEESSSDYGAALADAVLRREDLPKDP
jgi:hypothetical protein